MARVDLHAPYERAEKRIRRAERLACQALYDTITLDLGELPHCLAEAGAELVKANAQARRAQRRMDRALDRAEQDMGAAS